MSSLFFFVSAKRCYEEENKLLSAIGYYYSLFHISKALLFLLPNYSIDDVKGITHKKVSSLILTDFIQRKMLNCYAILPFKVLCYPAFTVTAVRVGFQTHDADAA